MALDAKVRIKFVRHALLLAYEGSNYYGMQYQGDRFPSIHGELLNAFRKCDLLPAETEDEIGDRRRLDINYASRTDRNVSATGQVVSAILPLYEDLPRTGVDTINRCLPDTIRVLGIRRAPKSFNAKNWCDARSYCYVIPTYAFASCDELTDPNYRISKQRLKEASQVLGVYEGFHNFFNYTSGRKYTEASVRRHIYSIGFADAPYLYHDEAHNVDVEFIIIRVKGQSFMLHQIRKMIGTSIWIMRNLMSRTDLWKSFTDERMNIPKAPGLGLFLDELHFDRFEEKFGKTHSSLNDWGDEVESKRQEVRQQLIINNIMRNECETSSMMQWLGRPMMLFEFFKENQC